MLEYNILDDRLYSYLVLRSQHYTAATDDRTRHAQYYSAVDSEA